MSESLRARRRRSKTIKDQLVPNSKFGLCVLAIAPTKPALWLAERVPCSERHANRLINGDRRPSARAIVVVVGELV